MSERQNPIVDFAAKPKPPPAGENEVQVHKGDGQDPNVTVFGTKTNIKPRGLGGGEHADMGENPEVIEITFDRSDEFDWPEMEEGQIAVLPPNCDIQSIQVHGGDGDDHSVEKALLHWKRKVKEDLLNDPHYQATPEEMGACKHCQGSGYEPMDPDHPHLPPETCNHCGGSGMEPTDG